MAFWQRKKNGHIFVYYSKDGKQIPLKRTEIAHLDGEPDHNVAAWVRDWELRNGTAPEERAGEIPAQYQTWVEEYKRVGQAKRGSKKTVADHVRMLERFVIPYFVVARKYEDPNDWPRAAHDFAEWMRGRKESEHQLARANSAIQKFWVWLGVKRKILAGLGIDLLPSEVRPQDTPLKRVLKPDEVLRFARNPYIRTDLRMFALLGYFFSLRPQETLALRRSDLLAGKEAAKKEACMVMGQHHLLLNPEQKLYGRFAVHVHRQKVQSGEFAPPKSGSKGWVACFSEEAARLLLEHLRFYEVQDSEAELFAEFNPDWYYKLWNRAGLGVTLKDLRRASCYWLGHYTSMDASKLRSHMRHKDEETTDKYMRRPNETPDGVVRPLDLDDGDDD